ncbi:hypothetical protein [Mangrovibacillus cuniculi]|uniref:Flagellar hook-length control protein-like C-terminal domain-containing protein n=1 Tax=Mangrovibacillus cuniculi TaxID=2593652 RepID=A0A7S8HF12_9BACI|nr:hypothetical protein [Mangrovibacillus cuniculi]QPC46328.1 hypothetical protein G8O30_04800 [Mangrovibacillus cuniculi]
MQTPSLQLNQLNGTLGQFNSSPKLQTGDIVHGKVVKWHPNQVAEVQIGNKRLMAKMDVPLEVGKGNWFQVEVKDNSVLLKVLPSGTESQGKTNIDQLLQALKLPIDKTMKQLVSLWLGQQQSLNKKGLEQAYQFLKENGSASESFQTIKNLLQANKPITSLTLQASNAMINTSSMSQTLIELEASLHQLPSTDKRVAQLLSTIQGIRDATKGVTKEAVQQFQTKFVEEVLNPSSKTGQQLSELLQSTYPKNYSSNESNKSLALAHSINQVIFGKESSDIIQKIAQQKGNLTGEQKEFLTQIVRTLPNGEGKAMFLEQVAKNSLTGENAVRMISNLTVETLSSSSIGREQLTSILTSTYKTEQPLTQFFTKLLLHQQNHQQLPIDVQEWIQTTTEQIMAKVDKGSTTPLLSIISKMLGTDLENQLRNQTVVTSLIDEQLKPNLLKILSDPSFASSKEQIESIIAKIQGGPLFSGDNGPQHHVTMNLPLLLQEKPLDLTLKWEGKRLDDGSIDPDYCRILFYLDLPNLHSTIIDMNVQQRIVNLTIYTDKAEEAEVRASALMEKIEGGLASISYTLSSLKWKLPSEETVEQRTNRLWSSSSYEGVDIRV